MENDKQLIYVFKYLIEYWLINTSLNDVNNINESLEIYKKKLKFSPYACLIHKIVKINYLKSDKAITNLK